MGRRGGRPAIRRLPGDTAVSEFAYSVGIRILVLFSDFAPDGIRSNWPWLHNCFACGIVYIRCGTPAQTCAYGDHMPHAVKKCAPAVAVVGAESSKDLRRTLAFDRRWLCSAIAFSRCCSLTKDRESPSAKK